MCVCVCVCVCVCENCIFVLLLRQSRTQNFCFASTCACHRVNIKHLFIGLSGVYTRVRCWVGSGIGVGLRLGVGSEAASSKR